MTRSSTDRRAANANEVEIQFSTDNGPQVGAIKLPKGLDQGIPVNDLAELFSGLGILLELFDDRPWAPRVDTAAAIGLRGVAITRLLGRRISNPRRFDGSIRVTQLEYNSPLKTKIKVHKISQPLQDLIREWRQVPKATRSFRAFELVRQQAGRKRGVSEGEITSAINALSQIDTIEIHDSYV